MDHPDSSETIIDGLFADYRALAEYLLNAGEISLLNTADSVFRKTLLLSAASYFEHLLTESLTNIFSEKTNGTEAIIEFLKNKAISRQYHTYFNWDGRNANQFFGLFGSGFRNFMSGKVSSDPGLDTSIKAFLELGQLRNELVHQNFANFPLEKTAEEIHHLYTDAVKFVEEFPNHLAEFIDTSLSPE